jgi:hypothetical protein
MLDFIDIAEGSGTYKPADRCRCFPIACGPGEYAACLDVWVAKKRIDSAHSAKAIFGSYGLNAGGTYLQFIGQSRL